MPAETLPRTEHSRELAQQLEILRTTFTAESEILARWGMTETLPIHLRNIIMDEWGRTLEDEPDQLGRSRERLKKDKKALEGLTVATKRGEPR